VRRATIARVTGDTSGLVRVTIEFDPASAPITGWFQREERTREEFRGMLELITLLEAARDDAVRGGVVPWPFTG
jgi:hypothetical protein